AKYGRGHAEKEDREREDPAQLGQRPVVRRRLGDAEQLCHRQVEHAERIGLADAQMHAQRGRRHHPAAESGLGYRAAAVEPASGAGKISGTHWHPLQRIFPVAASFSRGGGISVSCCAWYPGRSTSINCADPMIDPVTETLICKTSLGTMNSTFMHLKTITSP